MEHSYSFETWYKISFPRFVAYIDRRVRNKALAEDITSDIIVTIYSNFSQIVSPDAYFFKSAKIAIARIIDKKTTASDCIPLEDVCLSEKYEVVNDPLFIMEENEIEKEFNNVISMLPAQERDVYMSYRTKELTNPELEEHYNISHKALYKIIHKVNTQLSAVFPMHYNSMKVAC